ncbi:MAG: hypothetical protein RI924_733 [Bacteroidota bacterium]|jgi:hypothetical protein
MGGVKNYVDGINNDMSGYRSWITLRRKFFRLKDSSVQIPKKIQIISNKRYFCALRITYKDEYY